jgi:uncharacterized protein YndB with AHSA1/START domain
MTEPAAATRSLVIEREMAHPPQKVWRALTQGPLIEEWLMKNDFQPVVGRRFNFRATPMPHWNGVVDCQVLVFEPEERLSYSWNASGEEAAGGLKTVVSWTLTPTPGGTLVRMEQSGFRPEDEANYQGASYGWQKYMGELERVLAAMKQVSRYSPLVVALHRILVLAHHGKPDPARLRLSARASLALLGLFPLRGGAEEEAREAG